MQINACASKASIDYLKINSGALINTTYRLQTSVSHPKVSIDSLGI